jgi:cytidylate kinase
MIIAIDGPAASGKGTLGTRIAARYSLIHLDTGKLYRAVARDTLAAGASPGDEGAALAEAEALDLGTLGDPFLTDGRLGEAASIVASHPAVREALLAYQRAFARRKPGAVLDGRGRKSIKALYARTVGWRWLVFIG